MTQPHRTRYIATLAGIAALILVVGWRLRPAEDEPAAPSETELARLAHLTQRRTLENMSGYFAGVAGDVGDTLLFVPRWQDTAMIWTRQLAVVSPHPDDTGESLEVRLDGDTPQFDGPAFAAGIPVAGAVAASDRALPAPAPRRTTRLAPGDWVAAVWAAGEDRPFAIGHFVQATTRQCAGEPTEQLSTTLLLQRPMIGGGVFDLDGALVGMIVRCDGDAVAISVAAVDAWLRTGASVERRFHAVYGVALDISPPTEGPPVNASSPGAVITEVSVESPGDRAGLAPGDVIQGIDDRAVTSPADLEVLAHPDAAPATLHVLRGDRTLDVVLPPPAAAIAGTDATAVGPLEVSWDSRARVCRVVRVAGDSAAAVAGLMTGDQIAAVDHLPLRSLRQIRQALADGEPTLFEIIRNGRRLAVVVTE